MWGEPKDRERDVCDEGVTAEGSDALGLGAGEKGVGFAAGEVRQGRTRPQA